MKYLLTGSLVLLFSSYSHVVLAAEDPAQRGIAAFSQGQPQRAIEYYQEALSAYPDRRDVLLNLAIVQLSLEQNSAALESLRKAAKLDKKDPFIEANIRHHLGIAYQRLDDLANAARAYFDAASHPDFVNDLTQAAQCIIALPDATKEDRQAIRIALGKAFPEASVNIRILMLKLAIADIERTAISEYITTLPENPQTVETLATAHAMLAVTDPEGPRAQEHLSFWTSKGSVPDDATAPQLNLYGHAYALAANAIPADTSDDALFAQREELVELAATCWQRSAALGSRAGQRAYMGWQSQRGAAEAYAAGWDALGWSGYTNIDGWSLVIGNYGASSAWKSPLHLVAWLALLGLTLFFGLRRGPEPQAPARAGNGSSGSRRGRQQNPKTLAPQTHAPRTAPLEKRRQRPR